MWLRRRNKDNAISARGYVKKWCRLIAVFYILTAVSVGAATDVAGPDRGSQAPAFVPGELLVKFRPEVRREAAAAYQYWFDISTRRTFAINGYQQVRLPAGTDVEEALELYLEDPDVEHAEPNYIVSADIIPNDTYFDRLWGLHSTGQNVNGTDTVYDADIDAMEAWDATTGSADVVVAVIDSGVDVNHPDLEANIWENPGEVADNGIDDDGNGYVDDVNGWDFFVNDNDPRDAHGHGTHVAGTIAAVGNNNIGVAGVSWSAKIMVLRFLDAWGFGSTANAIAAIEYANANGADVINNSWGGGGYVQSLKAAIDASGAVVVCAAGNSGLNTDSYPHYPSSYTSANIISVAASNQNDKRAPFSNYGTVSVDVAAPGVNIYSAAPGRETVWQDDFSDGNISGWTTGGTNNSWNATNEEAFSDNYSLSDRPYANYKNNTSSWAYMPVVNLSSRTASKLEFKIYGTAQSGVDILWVEASTNSASWNPVSFQLPGDPNLYNGVSGNFGSWTTIEADLEAYDGSSSVYVRFWFITSSSTVAEGYCLDDVKVTAASSVYSGDEYTFKKGTSMATPHVAGLAALIKALHPALTNLQIKALIKNSVDVKSAWSSRVASGGRINAATALASPQISNVQVSAVTETTAVITWTTDKPSDSVVQYGPTSRSWDSYPNTESNSALVTSHSITISNLNLADDYYFRVGSTDAYGNGPDNQAGDTNPSAEAMFTTASADPPSIVQFPVINFAADTITITYDEPGMQGATAENHYSFSPSMNFASVNPKDDDIADLGGSAYRLPMASIPAYQIFTLTVSGITDLAGLPVTPASITINDNDDDGMANDWETAKGLNPAVDDSAADPDGDGYTNLEEYQARTHPRSAAEAPFVIKDSIPEHSAGISDTQRVPHNTTVAVLLESAYGIDTTDNASVQFSITDGVNASYTRNLGHSTVRFIILTADPVTQVTGMWVVYDRSEESAPLQNFPYDSNVNIKVDATDIMAKVMFQVSFGFKVETEAESAAAWEPENLPHSGDVAADDPDLGDGLDDGIQVNSGDMAGAKIIFASSELQTPLFGPMNEIPPVNLSSVRGVGIPMNLQPPAVFDNPVKILIPCPGTDDVSGLNVYYYDGNSWVWAVDAAGNARPGGEGLVLPGSRVNHNDTDPPTIEIRVYHFSGFQSGAVTSSSDSFSGGAGGGGGGGGGCFIAAASRGSVLRHLIFYVLFNLVLVGLGIYALNNIMRRR